MPVLSFTHDRYDVLELGTILAAADVHARSRLPLRARGPTTSSARRAAGTVRVSTGPGYE